jgi:hypothetical protein
MFLNSAHCRTDYDYSNNSVDPTGCHALEKVFFTETISK